MRRDPRGYRLLFVIGLLTLVADQGTKYLAVSGLTDALEDERGLGRLSAFLFAPSPFETTLTARRPRLDAGRAVHPDYFHLRYVENPGAAWGLWSNLPDRFRQPFFLGVSVLALGFISFMYSRLEGAQRFLRVALALVMGGAVGNFVDRLLRGYVIDFIDWHWRNSPGMRWPTFNVADVAITLGVAFILAESLRAQANEPSGAAAGVGLAPGAGGRGA
ncbi:MAG TPA: signal peptidase II [Myxococcaceae bacterium]|nr:signal peptidase II [Myxococcaceae bacterium]